MPCITNPAEHTQAFLGKPGSTGTQPAIRVIWYYEAHLGFDLSIQVSTFGSIRVHIKGAFSCILLTFTKWIDQEQYISL